MASDTAQAGATGEPQIAGSQTAGGQVSAVAFPPADAQNDENNNDDQPPRPAPAAAPAPPAAVAVEDAAEAPNAQENELAANENQGIPPQQETPPPNPLDASPPSPVNPLLPPAPQDAESPAIDEENGQGNANQLNVPPPQQTDINPVALQDEQEQPPPAQEQPPPPEQEQEQQSPPEQQAPPPEQLQPSPPEQQQQPPPPQQEQEQPTSEQEQPPPEQEQPPPEQQTPPPEQLQLPPPDQEQPPADQQEQAAPPEQAQPPPEQEQSPPPEQTQVSPEQEQPPPPEQEQAPPENPPPAITEASSSSTTAIIGSAFAPPATTNIVQITPQDNNANENAENGDAPGNNVEGAGDNANQAAAGDQSNAAEGSTLSAATPDPATDTPNLPPNAAPDNPPADATNLASTPLSPSGPIIPGLGQDFGRITESDRSTDSTDNDSSNVASTTAGIGGATSLITSAIATGRPTETGAGGSAPTPSITRETTSGINAISSAFSNPATRTRSIGFLVAAVVGFILIAGLVGFLVWYFRRKRNDQQGNSSDMSGDNEKGDAGIGNPVQVQQQNVANYDPSAELMGDSNGLDYGPSQPLQLDTAMVNRASRLSESRKSFLDIYGGANTPYPQDVVDGSGRPLTQRFLMPDADKFQLKELEYQSPFSPKVPGLNAPNQRNISAESNLSDIPENINPNQPAPFAGQEGPMSPIDPALSNTGRFNQIQPDPTTRDPFSDDNIAPLPPLAAAKIGGPMKSQKQAGRRQRTDSWMTVNTVATGKPGRTGTIANATTAGGGGLTRKPSRTDYTSVYMRNPFIDPPDAGGGGSGAPPMPTVPAIPKHLQQGSRAQQTESVTLMLSPTTAQPPPPQRQQAGAEVNDDDYAGVLDAYHNPPNKNHNKSSASAGARARKPGHKSKNMRSNPFDLEVRHPPPLPPQQQQRQRQQQYQYDAGGGGGGDDDVRSVQSWLSGVAEAERTRMERENMI